MICNQALNSFLMTFYIPRENLQFPIIDLVNHLTAGTFNTADRSKRKKTKKICHVICCL